MTVQTTGTFAGGTFRSSEIYSLERTFAGGGSSQVTINVRQAVQAVPGAQGASR